MSRSMYLELRIIPAMLHGEPLEFHYSCGCYFRFTAREIVANGDYQRLELERAMRCPGHVQGLSQDETVEHELFHGGRSQAPDS